MTTDLQSQIEIAQRNAKTAKETWYVVKFPNSTLHRAVSSRFFASQPHLKSSIVHTEIPTE